MALGVWNPPGLGFHPGIPLLPECPAHLQTPNISKAFGDPAGGNGVKIQGVEEVRLEEVFHVQQNPGMHTQILST